MNDYMEEGKELVRRAEAGEISLFARIGNEDIVKCYVENSMMNAVSGQQAGQEQLSPIEKLDKQDKRNKEIAREKTVEDTKKQILEVDMTETKFGADEEKMIYFFLLSSLRKEHFAAVGIEGEHSPYLSNEDKTNIVANLTPKAKAVIRRDFLIENFKNAYGSNAIADMLLEFAGKHMPERLADIENGHNEVYEKRHQRIEEKKAVLLVQEQAKQEAEQTEADADNEKQPQSQEVAA